MEMYKMYSVSYHLIEELSTEQINAIKKIAKISVDFEDLLKSGVNPPMMDNFYLDEGVFGTKVPMVRFFDYVSTEFENETYTQKRIPMVRITNNKEETYICELKTFL